MKALLNKLDRYQVFPESVLALSVVFFLISLALPGLSGDPLAHKYPAICAANYGSPNDPSCTWGVVPTHWFGIVILFAGWTQLFSFQIASFAWLANPMFILAIILAQRGVLKEALITASLAMAFGLLALAYPTLSFPLGADGYRTAYPSFGFVAWEASFIVLFIYCRALSSQKS